jgi:hypothetical protein
MHECKYEGIKIKQLLPSSQPSLSEGEGVGTYVPMPSREKGQVFLDGYFFCYRIS